MAPNGCSPKLAQRPPSSSGPGHRPFKAATRVRIPLGAQTRRSELIALRWTDFDLDWATVWISRGIVAGADGLVEKDTKIHAARRVPRPDQRRRGCCLPGSGRGRARVCEHNLDERAFVFSHEVDGSKPWHPDSASRGFARLCRKAGLSGVRLHDLRPYVATRLLAAGVDVRTVAGRLGHRNASTTRGRQRPRLHLRRRRELRRR
jgi:integrase